MRILIVDDFPDCAEMIALCLQLDGHDTRMCHCGIEALTLVDSFEPELAFIDIGLPDISGYNVIRLVRAARYPTAPYAVAISTRGPSFAARQSIEAGFDDHIDKPITREALRDVVRTVSCRRARRDVPAST